MAYEQQQICITKAAATDLSTYQFCFMKMSGSGANTVTVCTAQGEDTIGVLQNKPKTGQAAQICVAGITKLKANDVLNDMAAICTDTNGEADIATTADYVAGRSLHGSTTADGDIITAAINCLGAYIY